MLPVSTECNKKLAKPGIFFAIQNSTPHCCPINLFDSPVRYLIAICVITSPYSYTCNSPILWLKPPTYKITFEHGIPLPNRSLPIFLLLIFYFAFSQNSVAQTNIVLQDDFEGQSIFGGWDGVEGCCTYTGTFNTTIKRTGRQSMRVELRKSDPDVGGSKRAELTDNSYPIPPETNRRWWSFSNYLPADFGRDSVHEILAQWHDRPKTSTVSLNPPLSLQIYKGNWIIKLRYDSVDVNVD